MKYLFIFLITLIPNCEKKVVEVLDETNPILVKIEAEHIDGDVVESPILLVR